MLAMDNSTDIGDRIGGLEFGDHVMEYTDNALEAAGMTAVHAPTIDCRATFFPICPG
jgi:hypothetical protein